MKHQPGCPLPFEMSKSPEFRRYGVMCKCTNLADISKAVKRALRKKPRPAKEGERE